MPRFIEQPSDVNCEEIMFEEDARYYSKFAERDRLLFLRDKLESIVHARDEDYIPTVYVDPTVIRSERARELVEAYYQEKHPGLACDFCLCERGDLSMSEIFRYPEAEALFLARGYVSDMDVRSFGRGGSRAVTAYLRHNEDICFHQLRAIAALLRSGVGGLGRVGDADRQLAELVGGHEKRLVPLVEYDGMLLPRSGKWHGQNIHLAYEADIKELQKDDRGNPIAVARVSEIERDDQIAFEVANSVRMFGGATPEALALWQTQVLAVLRKAANEVAFLTGRELNRAETDARESNEMVLRSFINAGRGGHAVDMKFHAPDHPHLRETVAGTYLEKLTELTEAHPGFTTVDDVKQGISPSLAFVAAINGSTYAPHLAFEDSVNLQDVSLTLHPVGRWVWSLKNRRHAILDRYMARRILEVLGVLIDDDTERNLDGFGNVLGGRFAEPVWEVLRPACESLVEDEHAEPIAVTYEWSRGVDDPWSASRTGNAMSIRGPLLDFPLHAAVTWNERAAIVEEEGGFTLRRAR